MRRSGRTSRIIDFAVDQIFSIGEVIVHNHLDHNQTRTALVKEFIEPILERTKKLNNKNCQLSYEFMDIISPVPNKQIRLVHFYFKSKTQ